MMSKYQKLKQKLVLVKNSLKAQKQKAAMRKTLRFNSRFHIANLTIPHDVNLTYHTNHTVQEITWITRGQHVVITWLARDNHVVSTWLARGMRSGLVHLCVSTLHQKGIHGAVFLVLGTLWEIPVTTSLVTTLVTSLVTRLVTTLVISLVTSLVTGREREDCLIYETILS